MNESNPHLWLHLALLQLLEENRTDSLTGILNRRGFEEALAQYVKLVAAAKALQRVRAPRHRTHPRSHAPLLGLAPLLTPYNRALGCLHVANRKQYKK